MDTADWMQELSAQMKSRQDPWVVLEGRHAVESAMTNWWDIVGVLAGEHSEWSPPEWSGLVVVREDRQTLEAIAGYRFHRGVLGLARQPEEVSDVQGLLSELGAESTVVVCPRLSDPSNVGAVIRNAAALGADAVLLGSEGASPFDRKAVRASSGALFGLQVRVADSGQILRCLKAAHFRLIGTTGEAEAGSLDATEPVDGRVALVIGSEADGLGSFWMKACDRLVRIPMAGGVDSLNAAAASAIFLWEMKRLRMIGQDEMED